MGNSLPTDRRRISIGEAKTAQAREGSMRGIALEEPMSSASNDFNAGGRFAPLADISQNTTIPTMTKATLRFFFDFGAGGCLWAGDDVTRSKLGVGPLDATMYDLQGNVSLSPQLLLPSNVCSLINRLDQDYLSYLNPLYPPDPSLWTQAKCDRFNSDVDKLLLLLQAELGTKFVIIDEQKRHAEAPALGEFLAANPNQKPIP